MSVAADNQVRGARAFAERALSWWLSELRAAWRELAPAAAFAARSDAVLEAGERYWLLRRRQQPIGQIDCALSDPETTAWDLRTVLGGRRQRGVTVEIPIERALTKRIMLPAVAEREIDRVLRFEVARHFPFPADRVYLRHRVVSGAGAARGTIEVELIAVPREIVAEVLAALKRAELPLREVVVVGPDSGQPIALPVAPVRRKLASRERVLLALLAALCFGALASPVLHDRLRIAAIEREMVALEPRAKAVLDVRERDRNAADRMAGPLRLVAARPPLVAVLDELTRAVPDGSWLQSLSLSGHELVIDGLSPSAATLALALERSRLFAKVTFRAPITRDAATGLEHFQLSAAVAEAKP
jgi:general secretion pathway protein L